MQTSLSQSDSGMFSKISRWLLRWSGVLLVVTVWLSAALFGLYILAFYAGAYQGGNMERWNKVLPNLYEKGALVATSGIGLHFAAGGVILILGSIQLIGAVRKHFPALHRWLGRVYVIASLLTALGGLIFIFSKGTIGGLVMDIGFSLYGLLMLVAAIEAYRHAAVGSFIQHRAWAIRLFALAIGSWLYRMDYGFWFILADGWGHTDNFHGVFDRFMAFWFYLPNLLVAEVFIREVQFRVSPVIQWFTSFLLLFFTGFLFLGTYYFTIHLWGPVILKWLFG